MTNIVNTTMSTFERGIPKDRIEDITDLQELKNYACLKNRYLKDWYLECLDCKSKHTCRAGKQVEVIMDKETAPMSKSESPAPEKELSPKEREICDIFEQKDPVRILLEGLSPESKAQAIYKKATYWKSKYPEMEAKYHMIEKVRFAINKPYDRMSVAEAYKELYGEELKPKTKNPEKEEVEKMAPVKKPEPESDDISLEDFLSEVEDAPEPPKPVTKEPVKPQAAKSSDLSELKKQLEKEKEDYQKKIQEIDRQLDAIRTVESLLK